MERERSRGWKDGTLAKEDKGSLKEKSGGRGRKMVLHWDRERGLFGGGNKDYLMCEEWKQQEDTRK